MPPMQCTLLIPHLFWPRDTADQVTRDLDLPELTKLLARARGNRDPATTPEAWLCQAFGIERQQDWPIAPLTAAIDEGESGDGYWLRADPVHLKVSRDRLLLVDSALLDVAAEEAQSLVRTLNEHFADEGIAFRAPKAKRWYATLARAPRLTTRTISEVAGKDVHQYLPSGADALAWHGIFNEVQMLLHEHPVNERREARGEPALNSVWFWGGGVRPDVRGTPFDAVWSNNEVATALAAASGIRTETAPSDGTAWLARASLPQTRSESHLIVLDDLASAVAYQDVDAWRTRLAELDTRWFAPLLSAVRKGRITQLSVAAPGEASCSLFVLHRADLLKLWRRAKSFSAYA
jgi:hypothetical protein